MTRGLPGLSKLLTLLIASLSIFASTSLDSQACSKSKGGEKRIFQAQLHGVICKPCIKELLDEIKSSEGVLKAKAKTFKDKKSGKKQARLKVIYRDKKFSKEDLVEIIKFRDLLPISIEDLSEAEAKAKRKRKS